MPALELVQMGRSQRLYRHVRCLQLCVGPASAHTMSFQLCQRCHMIRPERSQKGMYSSGEEEACFAGVPPGERKGLGESTAPPAWEALRACPGEANGA